MKNPVDKKCKKCFQVHLFHTIACSLMLRFYIFVFLLGISVPSFSQDSPAGSASYFMFRNSDTAFYLSNKIIRQAKDSSSHYLGRFLLGQCIFWQGHIDSSLAYYNESEKYFSGQNDSLTLMKVYLEKGNTLKVLSLYDKSYDYLMKALSISQSIDSIRWQAVITIHLAEHARAMGNKENALMYIDRAFNIHNISSLKGEDLAELYHRKAAIEHEFGTPEKAEDYSLQSLKLSEPAGNLHQQATSYNELGYYYSTHATGDRALNYYSKAEEIWKKLNFKRYYIWVWRNISRQYGLSKHYEQSNQLLKQILVVSEPNRWDEVSADVAQQAAFNYEELKRPDSALAYYKKFIAFRASAEAKVKSSEFQDVIVKYATREKEQQLRKQEEATAQAKREEEKASSQRNFILFLLGVLVILFMIIGYLSLKMKRQNILLAESSIKIASINRQLQSELSQKNILFSELHHRVKNNLAILSGLINLQKDLVTDAISKDILLDTQNRIYSIAMIHRTLYSENNSENIDFQKYLMELSNSLIATYKKSKEKIECHVDLPYIFININKGVPLALIMNELLSNSLKHAFQHRERGKITVNANIENGLLHLHYYDDGPGFNADFENLPTSSLGLQLVKILSEQLDAEFNYEFRAGHSEFTFLIPLKK